MSLPMRTPPFDPYALSPESIQAPPPSFLKALRRIGPGLILAGSIVGTGELIATTHAGAKAGFALLWLVILSCFLKVFVQIELGRYAISSGETTMTGFCRVPRGRLITWWWFLMMMCTVVQLGAMVGGVGQAVHLLLPGVVDWIGDQFGDTARGYLTERPDLPWSILTALTASGLLLTGSYRLIEKLSTVFVGLFTLMTVACVLLLVGTEHEFGWAEISSGMSFELPEAALMVGFALIGLTGVGANELIAYPYWCIEKGYARSVGPREDSQEWADRARGWLRVMKLDAWISCLVYTIATVAFYLLGAAVLNKIKGEEDSDTIPGLLSDLSSMYAPILGKDMALWFIAAGAIVVLYSTLVSASAGNSRMLTDFLRVNRLVRIENHAQRKGWIGWLGFAFPFVGLGLIILIGKPKLMVIIGGIAQSVTLPIIAGAAIYLRHKHTDRRLTPGMLWDLFLWLSTTALLVAAVYGVWNQFAG